MSRRFLSVWFPKILKNSEESLKELQKLCLFAQHYTPLTSVDEPDGLLLDITGCAHLWDGERNLLNDLEKRFKSHEAEVSIGIAPTPLAAHALSRFRQGSILTDRDMPRALYQLPIAALRLPNEVEKALDDVGFKWIQEILRLPRLELFKRFGKVALDRIDEMLGDRSVALTTMPAPIRWVIERPLMDTCRDAEHLGQAIELLLSALCQKLEQKHLGVLNLTVILKGSRGIFDLAIGLSSPTTDPNKLLKLLKLKLDKIDLGLGVDAISIEATRVDFLIPKQEVSSKEALSDFIDTVVNNLGQSQIYQLLPVESHIPEMAVVAVNPNVGGSRDESESDNKIRPVRLIDPPLEVAAIAMLPDSPPARIQWQSHVFLVDKASGPERIEGEWWKGMKEARDYYRIEDNRGRRLWVYRQGLPARWFVHGLFA